MKTSPFLQIPFLPSLLLFAALAGLDSRPVKAAGPEQSGKIVAAAGAFLETLNATERGKLIFDFNDAAQRVRWSNLPLNMAERRGLRMGDLKPGQRDAAMKLLATVLSKMGYEKVVAIVEANEVLRKENTSGTSHYGRDQYLISFMGKPSATEPWMIQFGGHHLGLNVTLAGEQGVLTPSLIAVQPAKFTLDGKTVRPMGRETDKALGLLQTLTEAQRKQAILGVRMQIGRAHV